MKILEKNSAFSLYASFSLSPLDEEVLSFLYLPLIKANSYSLYHVLYSLISLSKNRGYFQHDELKGFLGLNDSSFLEARSQLEAIGLLETYRKEEKDVSGAKQVFYLYKIIPPASPKKFFDDVLLRASLSSQVGKKEYFELKSFFKVSDNNDFSQYKDITTQFKDVYSPDIQSDDPSLNDDGEGFLDKKYKSQVFFDKKKLQKLLSDASYDYKKISKNKEVIISTAVLYGLKEEDVSELIIKNTDSDGLLFLKGFVSDARSMSKYQKIDAPQSNQTVYGDSQVSRYLKAFNNITPIEYLSLKFNAQPSPYMLKAIETLKKDTSLSNSILNVVLDYSFKKTNGEFNPNYFSKVAYSLTANNINSAYDAMVYLNSRDFEISQVKNKKSYKAKETSTEKKDAPSESVKKDDFLKLGKKFGL